MMVVVVVTGADKTVGGRVERCLLHEYQILALLLLVLFDDVLIGELGVVGQLDKFAKVFLYKTN